MKSWINDVPDQNREKVKDFYNKARTIKEKLEVLKEWHPKRYVNLKPIRSLEEYFKYIKLTTNDSTWFRGESRDHGHLIPKLYRNIDNDKVADQHDKERKYYQEFQRRARTLAPTIDPNDKWSWYFMIQHYGGPTRLLDWTQDAAIALFFALDTNRESKKNPIVTLIQPTVLSTFAAEEIGKERSFAGTVFYPGETLTNRWIVNIIAENDHSNMEMPDCPIPLLPPYSDSRITAQRSCFTLFGRRIQGFIKDGKHIVCPCCDQHIIYKLVIDGHKKEDLRKELIRIGVTGGKIFPGLDGLNKELTEELFGQ